MDKRIVVTGGHLTPALAVIEELQKHGWEIIFIGRKYALEGEKTLSIEYKTVNDLGFKFLAITTGRLQRSFTRYTAFSLLKIPVGFFQSLYWLIRLRPKVIVSFGSYVALPVALAGWLLRIPVITHEQSVIPGLTTKIISKMAQKVCVSWPQTEKYFPQNKVILTGNPLRREILNKAPSSNFQFSSSDASLPLIYVTGGSLGAHAINETVGQILAELLSKYKVIHQCGDAKAFNDFEKLQFISSKLKSLLKERYFLTKHVGPDDIGWVLNNADLVVSRAGANTVTELAALGKPAILIPLPWAGQGEQLENARLLETVGTAAILNQEELTSQNLLESIGTFLRHLSDFQRNAEKAQKLVKMTATRNLVQEISEVVYEKEQ